MNVESTDVSFQSMERSRNCCGVVTLYKPDEEIFRSIDSFVGQVERLFVVDNSPTPNEAIHQKLEAYPTVEIIGKGENVGVAKALNLGIRKGLDGGYSWLLTMDQDSYFCSEQLANLKEALARVDYSRTAIVAPTCQTKLFEIGPCRLIEELTVITSGSLLNLSLAEDIGFFDAKLFIDEVDHDYCLRANLRGYKVFRAANSFLFHRIGEQFQGQFLGIKKKIHAHSPKRLYFIARNDLYMRAKYAEKFPKYVKRNSAIVRRRILRMLQYSPNRKEYFRYYLLARRHFQLGIFGNPVGI